MGTELQRVRVPARPCLRMTLTPPETCSPGRALGERTASAGRRRGPSRRAPQLLLRLLSTTDAPPPSDTSCRLPPPPRGLPCKFKDHAGDWRFGSKVSPSTPQTRTTHPRFRGGPEGLAFSGESHPVGAQTFLVCARAPGAPLAEGSYWQRSLRRPPLRLAMKTVRKQWLEAISAYQFVLSFLFMGERPAGLGSPRRAGSGGRKARAPLAKGGGESQRWLAAPGQSERGGEQALGAMTQLRKQSDFPFSSFTQVLSSPFSSSSSSSLHSGLSLFSTSCGSSWTGTLPTEVSMAGLALGEEERWLSAPGVLPPTSLPQGGRRFAFVKTWSMWKELRDYFPVKVRGHHPQRLSASSLSPHPHPPHPLTPAYAPLGFLNSDKGARGRGPEWCSRVAPAPAVGPGRTLNSEACLGWRETLFICCLAVHASSSSSCPTPPSW